MTSMIDGHRGRSDKYQPINHGSINEVEPRTPQLRSTNSVMTALILSLSDDLIIEVLRLLHYQCLIKCSETCRTLCRVIGTSSLLQLIVELGKDGLICIRPDLNSNDVRSALEDWRRSWDILDWKRGPTSSYTGPFSGFFYGTYESGIFASMQYCEDATRIEWFNMRDFTHRSVNLSFRRQPQCFAIDPEQNLLVSIEFLDDPTADEYWNHTRWETYLRFTNLTTAGAHRGALRGSVKLDVPAFGKNFINEIAKLDPMDVEIVDRAVVWRVRHRSPKGSYPQVMIFNWQLGVCVYNSKQDFVEQRFDNFQLISDTVFVVTSTGHSDHGEILVYTFNITPGSRVPESPRLRCVLALPEHLPNIKMEYMYIRYENSSPLRSWQVDDVFSYASDEQLLLLGMGYLQEPLIHGSSGIPSAKRFNHELVIPTRVILRFAREAIKMGAQLSAKYVTWDNWGTRSTRFLTKDDVDLSVFRRAYYYSRSNTLSDGGLVGQKFLRFFTRHGEEEDTLQHQWYLKTLDYSRRQRDLASADTMQVRYHGYNDPTRIVAGPGSPFTEDIVTTLPYSEIMRPLPSLKANMSWKLDRNALIGVEPIVYGDSGVTLTTVNLTTYRF
ncbi:hypothetical protein BJ165DRAFT_175557 [Panaeolus papilionaceus]|nr:hypothetical protein BJ165DRAFT_175557 [Panaeolus papilionaceus]